MNDASPRFVEDQTGAASLISSEEGNLRLAELAQRAVELNAWVTEEGLRGATAAELFDGYCRRLSAMDVAIMRAYVSTQTLHPQWTGYGYTWLRELRSVREQQRWICFPSGDAAEERVHVVVYSQGRPTQRRPATRKRMVQRLYPFGERR